MKRYLLFDLDGTLTDPKLGITTCVQYALEDLGIHEPDLDKLECFIGPPLTDSFKEFYGFDEEQTKRAVAKYRERFSTVGLYENEIYRGIPKLLSDMRKCHMKMAIASSKPTVFVEKILEHFKIRQYFDVVVGSELDGTRSQKDLVVQEALNQLFKGKRVEKDQIFMIGDRKFDVEGAKAMGIESIGVAYGYGGVEELMEAHADYVVRSVEELRRFLLRGFDDGPKGETMWQKLWVVLYPYLLFQLLRILTGYVAYNLLYQASASLPASWFIKGDAGEITGFHGNITTIVSALGFVVGCFAIFRTAKWIIRKSAGDMYFTHMKWEPPKNYIFSSVATIGAVIGLNLLFSLTGFASQSETYTAVANQQYAANFFVGLLCYGLITPVMEEMLFRGVIYGFIRRFFNAKWALFGSALFFSMYHMNSVQGLYALLMGLLIGYLYEYFGEFKMPVLVHILSNILAFGLTYAGIMKWPGTVQMVICVISLVAAGVSLFLLARQKKVLW